MYIKVTQNIVNQLLNPPLLWHALAQNYTLNLGCMWEVQPLALDNISVPIFRE